MRAAGAVILVAVCLWLWMPAAAQELSCDLLIVGGGESACAAAVQAARMGVRSIVLVNDIDWLGGQFTAEAVCSIDENRGPDGRPPFPRSGCFLEIMDRIESLNLEQYGHRNPGNAWTSRTTCRPAEAEAVFEEWMRPFVDSGTLRIFRGFYPLRVETDRQGALRVVHFSGQDKPPLTVRSRVTIDASDWGDVIRLAGAEYEFGPDLQSAYGERNAPVDRTEYPLTEMNPITHCVVIEETDREQTIPRPPGFDDRRYYLTTSVTREDYGRLGWAHPPHRPFNPPWVSSAKTGVFYAGERSVYSQRRLVDSYGHQLRDPEQKDVILLCWSVQDYPLDVLPKAVVDALENDEPGASRKNIVEMTRRQRQFVFEDAKRHSLGMVYHLQTTVHERMNDRAHSFRRFRLTDEFGTEDHLPPKPYVRESLRMKAMYMMTARELRNLPPNGRGKGHANRYAGAMYHDGVAGWQFAFDFHPTGREFLPGDTDGRGPWQSYIKRGKRQVQDGRSWSTNSDRAMVPLRSLIPRRVNALLAAQHNIGFSSIVSSAVRLHDQTMAIGQAAGAAASVALQTKQPLRRLPFDPESLARVHQALCSATGGGQPLVVWPFRDLAPDDAAFTAANMLAVNGMLALQRNEVDFRSEGRPTRRWMEETVSRTRQRKGLPADLQPPFDAATRGEFAVRWWRQVERLPWKPWQRLQADDADADGIPDSRDPLPLMEGQRSWPPLPPLTPATDGLPDDMAGRLINFSGRDSPPAKGFANDVGETFDPVRGYGWQRDMTANHRRRGVYAEPFRDTFIFTREVDVWECALPAGRYLVIACIGDSGHPQPGQRVVVEGTVVADDAGTPEGRFLEVGAEVLVTDGRLTLQVGSGRKGCNTCLNWVRIAPLPRRP